MTYYMGARYCHEAPPVGALVVIDHQVYRVLSVNPVPEVDWTDEERQHVALRRAEMRDTFAPVHVVVRPVGVDTIHTAHSRDLHFRYQKLRHRSLHVFEDEHYPVCACCQEPMPCREELRKREAEKAIRHMSRYEQPGVCPACGELVTTRQKGRTYPNSVIPGGAPVTFHVGRRNCRWEADEYAKTVAGEVPIQEALPDPAAREDTE